MALFRAPAFRPLLLRLEDFRAPRRGALRALAERLVARFFAPPRLRPEDPDRDLFLPLFERLDFLAAAMGMLRVRGFVEPLARFAHKKAATFHITCKRESQPARINYLTIRVSPCRMIQRSFLSRPEARHSSRIFEGGSSIGSSVSLNVPQCAATIARRFPLCAADN